MTRSLRFPEITFTSYGKHCNFSSWVKTDWGDCPAKNTVIGCHNVTVSHLYGSAAGHRDFKKTIYVQL